MENSFIPLEQRSNLNSGDANASPAVNALDNKPVTNINNLPTAEEVINPWSDKEHPLKYNPFTGRPHDDIHLGEIKDDKNSKAQNVNNVDGSVKVKRRLFRKPSFKGIKNSPKKITKPFKVVGRLPVKGIKFIRKKLTRRVLLLGLLVLLIVGIIDFLLAWLYFEITSPAEVVDFFKGVDFNVYMAIVFGLVWLFIFSNIYTIARSLLKKKVRFRRLLILHTIIFATIIGIFLGVYVFKHPILQKSYPEYDGYMTDYSKPLEVTFNLPVRIEKLKPSIVPEMEGRWEWEPYLGINGITRTGKFYPTYTSFPEERFVLYVAGINKLTDKNEHEYGYVFKAPTLPIISSTSPKNGSTGVTRDEDIVLEIDKQSKELVDWDFKIEPQIAFKSKFEGNNIILDPDQNLTQGQTYTLTIGYKPKKINLETEEVIQINELINVAKLDFTTTKAPLLENVSPTGSAVRSDEKIRLEFMEEMDQESVEENFSITPEIAGELVWESEKILNYVNSEPLPKETPFRITIKTGTMSKGGGILEEDIVHEFTTIGKVKVNGFSPESGASYINENTNIYVHFDQEVDHQSAQERFYLSPYVPGSFQWEGNSMVYVISQSLAFQTTYSIKIAPGIKSVHGLDSTDEFNGSFTTRSNLVLFYVPLYYQPPGFACNIFTARMILAWKGYYVDHISLISEIGYNDNRSGSQWTGNPYAEYVGNADGSWGYGVYYPPIQNILAARGIGSTPYVGWNMVDMAKQIEQGRPVIIWRYNGVGGGQNISWTASDGTYVNAFNGMHGSVITGFIGTSDNPTSFYVNDPWLGQFWMNASTLDAYWSYSGRMALVVY